MIEPFNLILVCTIKKILPKKKESSRLELIWVYVLIGIGFFETYFATFSLVSKFFFFFSKFSFWVCTKKWETSSQIGKFIKYSSLKNLQAVLNPTRAVGDLQRTHLYEECENFRNASGPPVISTPDIHHFVVSASFHSSMELIFRLRTRGNI